MSRYSEWVFFDVLCNSPMFEQLMHFHMKQIIDRVKTESGYCGIITRHGILDLMAPRRFQVRYPNDSKYQVAIGEMRALLRRMKVRRAKL